MKMLKLATGTIVLFGTVLCSPSWLSTSAYAQQTPTPETSLAASPATEQRIIVHLNHGTDDLHAAFMALKVAHGLQKKGAQVMLVLTMELVQFAKDFGMGLRFEDLSGIRQTSKQRKKNKSDASENRDSWAFYQLEVFTRYKAIRAGVRVQSVPAPYTSKSDHRNGVLGKRNGDWFKGFDGYRCNADWNASQNIGQWEGFSCPLNLQGAVAAMAMADAKGGVNDSPLKA